MGRLRWTLAPVAALASAVYFLYPQASQSPEIEMPEGIAFRILFGLTDKEPEAWDGEVSVSSGKVLRVQGWRVSGNDATDGESQWRLMTRNGLPPSGSPTGTKGPMLENGVIVTISGEDPSAAVNVRTLQGSFSFRPQDIAWGTGSFFLSRRVRVDRVAPSWQLTVSPEEQDHPAMALSGDDVWVSFVEFVHGDRSKVVSSFKQEPADFDFLARPVGGDQVKLLHYSQSRRVWTGPLPVSPPGQDVMRTAVAVDGRGRTWVFWSANVDGNFDIYARSYASGRWGDTLRLTQDPGPDLNPVASRDRSGRVWVVWQGYRNENLEVLASALDGDVFVPEFRVSFSAASDWDPAVAAGPSGEIAVAWDTYEAGNYDIYFRRLRFEQQVIAEPPVPVAVSQAFEARPSISYDPQGRLWVAYEYSGTGWGKDFGAYETTGIALYQGHTVKVRCFEGGELRETAADIAAVLPVQPSAGAYGQGRTGVPAASLFEPDPTRAERRKPGSGPGSASLPRNSFPRLWVDPAVAVYVAFRNSSGVRVNVGTVWYEQLVFYDGSRWRGPVFLTNSDGLLDNRPVAVPLGPGRLLMVHAMDHRQSPGPSRRADGGDPVNTDLYATEIRLPVEVHRPELKAVSSDNGASEPIAESRHIARMRDYRVELGGEKWQLLRGEFHRHTEISADGGGDGPLIDAFRYFIDAAGMDWAGCCDHDNGGGREYFWWTEQKFTDAYKLGERFIPMFSYERSVAYPEGHRNVVFAHRGVRPLPRLPKTAADSPPAPAPDTQMLYRYLRRFQGVAASHTSATDMGTDWRDGDPFCEPVVELYQGDRQNYEMPQAPRSNSAQDSIGGWRPLGFVSLALDKGFRLGFESSSDHISTHISYANVWVKSRTREGILEALLKRRVYAATDNILADVRCGEHFMGEEFNTKVPPLISVRLWGTAKFARVFIVKDGKYVYVAEPGKEEVEFTWQDNGAERGKVSYYYVRGEQEDGELVWASPMWIHYE